MECCSNFELTGYHLCAKFIHQYIVLVAVSMYDLHASMKGCMLFRSYVCDSCPICMKLDTLKLKFDHIMEALSYLVWQLVPQIMWAHSAGPEGINLFEHRPGEGIDDDSARNLII